MNMQDAFRDLVQFVQFKKREEEKWWRLAFCKVAGCSHRCFSRFLICANGSKSRKVSHIYS